MSEPAPWRAVLGQFGKSNTGGLILLVAASWAVYQTIGEGFLSNFNLFTLSQLAAQTAVIGFSQLVVVATGRLNLAVGAVGVCVVMTVGWLVGVLDVNPVLGALCGLGLGTVLGALMGWLELKTRLSSFIVTLAMQSIYFGAVLILSRGNSVSTLPPIVSELGSATLLAQGISVLVVPALLTGAVLWLLYNRTSFGWKMLAVGANQNAAELGGVLVPRVILVSYGLSGLLAGLAALMEMTRVSAALPSLGTGWLLSAFIVPILGGTPLVGGSVSILGALLAALFIESINSGLVSLDVAAYWQQFAQAIVLLVAVLADRARRRHGHRRPVLPRLREAPIGEGNHVAP